MTEREDDYSRRREAISRLSETELEERFWKLCGELTRPLVELAEKHTSPSIERSVLLRMGFNSLEAGAIVEKCLDLGLLGKGAGHVVLKRAARTGVDYLEAGRKLAEGAQE
jgi:D-ornithine 4,5-aminomutase subunit alpha